MAQKRPYNLLIATGKSPQVITETICEIHRSEGRVPAAVDVITTRVGEAHGRALLVGEKQRDPLSGEIIEDAAERWPAFLEDVLGGKAVDLSFHVPEAGGSGLEDIRRPGDDTRFANLCYRLTEERTREGQLPLIGSIAGGHKTMSAHLMTAFSVYARPEDRITHILLSDPEKEYDPDFFYPEPGTPEYGRVLDLVDVRFPRLHSVIESDLIDSLPEDRQDLEGILNALDPHLATARDVSTIDLVLDATDTRLVFRDGDEVLDTCPLSPARAATLAVLADRLEAGDEAISGPDLAGSEDVERQRERVAFLCSKEAPKPWGDFGQVSRAVSALRQALGAVPVADQHLRIEGTSSKPVRYDWHQEPDADFRIVASSASGDWPFEALAEPVAPSEV
jgi:CRISPR-associated protein (TIGR02584 family)